MGEILCDLDVWASQINFTRPIIQGNIFQHCTEKKVTLPWPFPCHQIQLNSNHIFCVVILFHLIDIRGLLETNSKNSELNKQRWQHMYPLSQNKAVNDYTWSVHYQQLPYNIWHSRGKEEIVTHCEKSPGSLKRRDMVLFLIHCTKDGRTWGTDYSCPRDEAWMWKAGWEKCVIYLLSFSSQQ